jgi:hypothetical protein
LVEVFDGVFELERVTDGVGLREAVRDGDAVWLALFVLELVGVAVADIVGRALLLDETDGVPDIEAAADLVGEAEGRILAVMEADGVFEGVAGEEGDTDGVLQRRMNMLTLP